MEIINFTPSDGKNTSKFIDFQYDLYKGDKNFIPPFRKKIESLLNHKKNPFFEYGKGLYFLALKDNKVLGRIGAFRNPKMDKDNNIIGTVGYFECIENYDVAKNLLDKAFEWLKTQNVNKVIGPMNCSLFNSYRFKIDQFEHKTFFTEPYNKKYYPIFFERYGFKLVKRWFSTKVDLQNSDNIAILKKRQIKYKKRFDRVISNGYELRFNKAKSSDKDMENLYKTMLKSFSAHYGHYSISFSEFMYLIGDLNSVIENGLVTLFYKSDELHSFAIHLFDYAKAVKSMKGKVNTLSKLKFFFNVKKNTIMHFMSGILPQDVINGSGLASALFNVSLDKYYYNKKIKYVIHPLMYENNRSNIYSAGVGKRIGTYALYDYDI